MALEIPREQGPNLRTQPISRIRPGILLDRASFGGGPEVAAAMGASSDLARGMAEISGHHVERAEEARFNELAAQLAGEEVRLRTQLEKVEGLGALEASDRMLTDWDAFGEKLQGEAMTDRMRERLGSALALKKVSLQAFGEPYAQDQVKRYETQVLNERLDKEEAIAIQSGDPLRAGLSIEEQYLALGAHARATGKSQEWLDNQVLSRESRIHGGLIGRMLNAGKDQDAQKYFEANKGRLTPVDLLRLENAVQDGSTLGDAQRQADLLFHGSKTPDDAYAAAEKISDPKVRQLTERILEHRYDRQERAADRAYESAFEAAAKDVQGYAAAARTAGILAGAETPEQAVGVERWNALKVKDQAVLTKLWIQASGHGEPATNWGAWTRWSGLTPEQRAAIPDGRMMTEWRTQLDDQFFAAALRDRKEAVEALAKGDKVHLSELGGWEGSVRDTLVLEGIDPKADPERAARAELLIKTRIWAFEKQNDRKTTPKERADIMKDALKEKVLERTRHVMSPHVWTEGKEVLRLDAMKRRTELSIWGQRQRSYDVQVAVPLEKIGEKDRTELRNLLAGRGKKATDEKLERLAGARAMEDLELFDHILAEPDRD